MSKRDIARRTGWLSLALLFLLTGVVFTVIIIWQQFHQSSSTTNNTLKGTKLSNYTPINHITKLSTKDVKVGGGAIAKTNSTIVVNYVGAIADNGIIFDDSYDTGQAATFQLTSGSLIPGFYDGLLGMKVGGERQIFIPAKLAYGGNPPPGSGIPANADLVFDVILANVQ